MTAISRRLLGLAAAAGLALLAACNVNLDNVNAPGLGKDKDEAAREVYKAFASGDVSAISPRFAPEMQGPQAEAAIPQIMGLIPRGEPTKSRLASWSLNWNAGTDGRTENLVTNHEYTYPDTVVMAETVMARTHSGGKPGPWMIRGFHIKRNPVGGAATGPSPAQPATPTTGVPATPGSNEFITPEQAEAEASAAASAAAAESSSGAPNNRR